MDETSTDRCGYTWPGDYEVKDDPNRSDCDYQGCCYRETLSDTDRCAWHARPADTDEKRIQTLRDVRVDAEVREQTQDEQLFDTIRSPPSELLDGAILRGIELRDELSLNHVALREVDLSDANLFGADLTGADLTDADLTGTDLTDTDLRGADLTDANLRGADLTDANLGGADLTDADLRGADLTDTALVEASLPGANLKRVDLTDANLFNAYLPEANLFDANLTDVDLGGADLTGANLEQATLITVNLFDADLTKITPYGARIEAVQLNDKTHFCTDKGEYSRWWQCEGTFLAPPPRCGYDPKVEQPEQFETDWAGRRRRYQHMMSDQDTVTDREGLLTKAADTYRQFEELARQNAQPSLQSSMFVLRQDMQRKRYRERGQYGQWLANRVFRAVFKHGESFGRVVLTAVVIILLFAGGYWQADLIIDNPDTTPENQEFIDNPFDAVYFSTLTFTTLGLGDFQPAAASHLGRGLVLLQAALGAILIATFVFVLGRRAAR